jgi:hypothetical protein
MEENWLLLNLDVAFLYHDLAEPPLPRLSAEVLEPFRIALT